VVVFVCAVWAGDVVGTDCAFVGYAVSVSMCVMPLMNKRCDTRRCCGCLILIDVASIMGSVLLVYVYSLSHLRYFSTAACYLQC
jgi:hypothetical protein